MSLLNVRILSRDQLDEPGAVPAAVATQWRAIRCEFLVVHGFDIEAIGPRGVEFVDSANGLGPVLATIVGDKRVTLEAFGAQAAAAFDCFNLERQELH